MRTKDEILKEIVELEKNVRDLEARIPPHSIPVELLQKLEDVQEELDRRKKELELLEK
ncbi:hypothetical protein ES703_08637 [subsurface metagenome]